MAKDFDLKLKGRYVISGSGGSAPILTASVLDSGATEVGRRFKQAIRRGSEAATAGLREALEQAMKAGVWETSSGTGDIVDTGELMKSGTVTITDNEIKIAYSAPYAALVHYGGYIMPYGNRVQEKVYLPPRPWVDAVLSGKAGIQKFDFEGYYRRAIEDEFG